MIAVRRLLIVAAYLVLILAFTWPLPAALGDHLVLARGSDVWPHIWNFAWVRTALVDLHHSPYFTHSIFYPTGVPLVYHALNIFTATVSIPLQALFGLVAAFNLMLLANLLAAALAAYWLGRVLGLDRLPAFLLGLLFACSPPVSAAVSQGQAELASVFWMPLYAGLLVRGGGLRLRGLPPGGWPYLAGAALALVGSALAIWYWFVSLLVFTAVYGLVELWAVWRTGDRRAMAGVVGRLALVGGVALVLLSPLLVLMVQEQLRSGADVGIARSGTSDAVVLNGSQDPLAWFRPLPGHIDIAQEFLNGANLGLGWTVLALIVVAVALLRGPRRRGLVLWGLAALALAVLALGPHLVLNGESTGIPLPYSAILQLPGAAAMRVPLRFATLLALCLAVPAAFGLAAILDRVRPAAGQLTVTALAVALVVVEFFGPPRVLIQPEAQPFFQQLAAHPSPCLGDLREPLAQCDAVLELPQATWIPPGMYHQAISKHPMVGGYISRHYPYDFAVNTPGVAQLIDADPASLGDDILTPSVHDTALQAMDYYGVRYVVVHPLDDYRPAADLQRTLSILFPTPGTDDDGLTVYTVPHVAQDRAFFYLGENWHAMEQNAAGLRWRWTDQSAAVHIVTPEAAAGAYTLALDVYSVSGPRTLVATLDGQELGRYPVTPAPGGKIELPLTLAPGEHLLTLASVEPALEPPGDKRHLSLGYHALTLTRR